MFRMIDSKKFDSDDDRIEYMGTYYYVDDPESEGGHLPIYEDDYIAAIFKIAKKSGVKITDKMILEEVKSHWKKPEKSNKKRKNKKKRDENN